MSTLSNLPVPLLEWYRDNARTLPWRSKPTPYRVWVSEIMLQQTRVAAVLDYFDRFINRFPTPADLALASEDELMKQWQGLGYYSRARNLQRAARQIVEKHNGQFPYSYDEIRALSGVGDYTAGAIASIAFGLPYPAVDGNLLRIVARVTGDFTDVTSTAMKKACTAALQEIIPLHAPGSFNQAMMDLGAMVCLPNGSPLCDRCPISEFCTAYKENLSDTLPVRKKKKARRIEERDVFLFFHDRKVAIRRRTSRGLLAGLWEFPSALSEEKDILLQKWGITLSPSSFAGTGRHIFSHIEWHMSAYLVFPKNTHIEQSWVWADKSDLNEIYALPSAFSAFLPILETYL